MVKKIILFPFGGNAREALSVIEAINRRKKTWQVIGFLDDNQDVWGRQGTHKHVQGSC